MIDDITFVCLNHQNVWIIIHVYLHNKLHTVMNEIFRLLHTNYTKWPIECNVQSTMIRLYINFDCIKIPTKQNKKLYRFQHLCNEIKEKIKELDGWGFFFLSYKQMSSYVKYNKLETIPGLLFHSLQSSIQSLFAVDSSRCVFRFKYLTYWYYSRCGAVSWFSSEYSTYLYAQSKKFFFMSFRSRAWCIYKFVWFLLFYSDAITCCSLWMIFYICKILKKLYT